jgi:orotidine-5'-phosphate decarboxylase
MTHVHDASRLAAAKERLIFALDVPSASKAVWYATHLAQEVGSFKVGLELFSAAGPQVIRDLIKNDAKVFLDLKLHDIPATVGRAVSALAELGVSQLTVHAAGGPAMVEAAVKAAREADSPPAVLAVTALTSLDEADLEAVGIDLGLRDLVVKRAALAREAGAAGVVASVKEAAAVRVIAPEPFAVVTPGIRADDAEAGDQKRHGTVAAAVEAGASHLVVGRPIRDAADPVAAARDLVRQIADALPETLA